MESCVKHSTIRFFADDTIILKHIYSYLDVDLLQQDLYSIIKFVCKIPLLARALGLGQARARR